MSAEPTRQEVDALAGATVLEFGASWCGFCQAARPLVDGALAANRGLRHIWIEDGRGKPLGRSFHVTLWPTLVFLRDGRELSRLVRPHDLGQLHHAVELLVGGAAATGS